MGPTLKQKDLINVKKYITDNKGHKIAAVIEIEELNRVEDLLEDISDLKTIEDRKNEQVEDYETYSRKRKSRIRV